MAWWNIYVKMNAELYMYINLSFGLCTVCAFSISS
jgi:hypothetical protein